MANQDDYKYIDLTTFNDALDGGASIPCILSALREEEVIKSIELDDYLVSVARFCVSSNKIPAYIPRIIGQQEITRISNEIMRTYPTATIQPCNPFLTTDLYVLVYEGSNCNVGFLQWQPEDVSSLYPLNSPSRKEVIQSPYYHCYSSYHLFKLISNLISSLLSGTCHIIVSDDGSINFLLTTIANMSICFSPELSKLLPLHTVPDGEANSLAMRELVIDAATISTVSLGVPAVTYYQLSTKKTPIICPFSKLMVLSGITTSPQITSTNMSSSNKLTDNIMTDYSLENIGIPDIIYQRIIYEPSSYDRWIPLRPAVNGLRDFNFRFICKTPDNYDLEIKLEPKCYVTMKLVLKRVR